MEPKKWNFDLSYAKKKPSAPPEPYKPMYILRPMGSEIDMRAKKFRRPVAYTFLVIGIIVSISMPAYAFYWKHKTMKDMEEGVYQDYDRIRTKGKTLSEIPRKY